MSKVVKTLFFLQGIIFVMLMSASVCMSVSDLSNCSEIENPDDRLKCFDQLSGRSKSDDSKAVFKEEQKEVALHPDSLTVMEKQWDLNPKERKKTFALTSYRLNYFLPLAYNSSPNKDTALDNDPNAKAQYNEAKFQLSFKVKAWQDVFGQDIDIWLAYTQLSFWQLYNSTFSAPFRDTNYEPEMLINFRTRYEIPGLQGLKLQFINVGFNHQSNGRSRPLSRSWNRIVANFGLEKQNFNLLLKPWYRLPEDEADDDNPDLSKYMGYGELWATYYYKDMRFAVMLRNNLRGDDNKGAIQLDFTVPLPLFWNRLSDKFGLYVQYFNGYGESLLDYYTAVNRISTGFMLVEW